MDDEGQGLALPSSTAALAPSGLSPDGSQAEPPAANAVETVTVPKSRYDALVNYFDDHQGTPCAQIRWQDRECELLAHICGNASMEDWRIDDMSPDQMRDMLKYLAKDARRLSGYDNPRDAADWVEAYADGRI